jgi:hypothetical protein
MALLEQALSAHTGHRGHKWDQDDDAWAWFGAYFIGTAASSDMIV